MRAGQLRHVADLERYTESKDENGAMVKTWNVLKPDIRCSIEPITGTETFIRSDLVSEISHKINIRYTDVTTKDRIVYNGRVFDIIFPHNWKEINKDITLLVKERM